MQSLHFRKNLPKFYQTISVKNLHRKCLDRPELGHILIYAHSDDLWSILWVHFKGTDACYFPLEDCRIIHFTTEHATNRMQFLFDLLFRVLDGNYTLGNFIYISQVLSLILAETYDREKRFCL